VAGRITSPFDELIESQAPSVLGPHGGYSSGRIDNFRYREILTFRSARTQVSGAWSEQTQSWDTLAVSVVEGLNILDTVTAERVVARVASRQIGRDERPLVTLEGSRIDGLRIGNRTLDFTLDLDKHGEPGYEIEIPQFGTVILGQVLIGERSRDLSMLQFHLGCAVNGNGSAGNGSTSGTPMPPPSPIPK